MSAISITEVEWHAMGDDLYPYYRSCDFCYESASSDAVNGKMVEDFRRFYEIAGPIDSDGLCACENCLDKALVEDPI